MVVANGFSIWSVYKLCALADGKSHIQGHHFSFFPGGGQNFDRLPRWGQNMKKLEILQSLGGFYDGLAFYPLHWS